MKLNKLHKAAEVKILLAVLCYWSKYSPAVIVQNRFRTWKLGNNSLTDNYALR